MADAIKLLPEEQELYDIINRCVNGYKSIILTQSDVLLMSMTMNSTKFAKK